MFNKITNLCYDIAGTGTLSEAGSAAGSMSCWGGSVSFSAERYRVFRITCLSMATSCNNCNYVKINVKKQPYFHLKSAKIASNKQDHIALYRCKS